MHNQVLVELIYLSKNGSCILRSINDISRTEVENGQNNNSWTANVEDLLQRNELYDVWMFPESVNINVFIPQLQARLKDNFILEWRQGLNEPPHGKTNNLHKRKQRRRSASR